ncbi:hypothetical protein TKK_0003340 [Trichogramma kaykai]
MENSTLKILFGADLQRIVLEAQIKEEPIDMCSNEEDYSETKNQTLRTDNRQCHKYLQENTIFTANPERLVAIRTIRMIGDDNLLKINDDNLLITTIRMIGDDNLLKF